MGKDNILTGESISQAISTMTDAKLKDISFDITQSYTVSSVANSKQGEYLVTNGATQIIAYSDRTDFKIGDEVYVLTPESNPENPRFIMGKKEKYENSYTKIDPYENFIEIEKIKVLEGEENIIGLIANDENVSEYEIESFENLSITGYDSIGISAEFQTSLPKTTILGNYGLRIDLYYSTEAQEEISISKSFDSAYMMGSNPYFFNTFLNQKIVFPISNLIKTINRIEVVFYQNNNFLNEKNEEILAINQGPVIQDPNFDSNIKIRNLTLSFGYDISNIKDDYVQICCEEKTSYKEENDLKNLFLRWVHIKNDKSRVFIDSDTFGNTDDQELRYFLNNCSIKWYRYNLNLPINQEDEYGGRYWEPIQTNKALTFNYSITPSIALQQESLKIVIVKDDSDNTVLSNEQKIIASDIIIFDNEEKIMDQSIIDLIKGFNLKCEDNSLGNYFVYDLTNQIIDYNNSSQIREIKCYMDNLPITSVNSLQWKFPKNNTMLSFLRTENSDEYEIETDNNYYILTAKNKNAENGYSIKYKIKSTYKENFYNNTVICSYGQNGANVCQTSFDFRFGNGGTNGTSSTLILENVYNKPLEDKDEKGYISSMAIQAILYNEQGEIEKNENILYNFSLYKPYNTEREDKLYLVQTGNLCTITPKDESIINEINILQCKVEGYGDYNLIAYYPIAISNSSDNFITGPTQIIYNNAGKASYNSAPYQLYNEKGKIDNCMWRIITEPFVKEEEDFSLFIPKISNNELYVNNQFIQNCPLIAAQAYSVNDGKETILFTQPILMLMNSWFSQVINEWDGKTLGINEEEGYILSKMLSAGKKNRNNQFSGVLLGDWSGTNSQDTITKNTGLYGFHEGVMSLYFKDDVTAAIVKAGKGQVQFVGNSGTIQSGLYQQTKTNGAFIDMVEGKIILANKENGQVVLNASSQNLFKTDDKNNFLDKDDNILRTDNGEEYYYTGENDEKIVSERVLVNGFPIIVSKDGSEENAKFKVAWDGTIYATNGKFSGHINATSGDINGNFNVYGTLNGATIKSGRFISTYNTKSKETYIKAGNTLYDFNKTYYVKKGDKYDPTTSIIDEKVFEEKKGELYYKDIEYETVTDEKYYPISFVTNMNNIEETTVGGLGLVPGKSAESTTEGLGLVSLSETCPLIFDAREAGAKINSNSGIYFQLASKANDSNDSIPYLWLTNNDKKVIFANFNEIWFNCDSTQITIGGTNLKQLIINLIKEHAPKPAPSPSEPEEAIE